MNQEYLQILKLIAKFQALEHLLKIYIGTTYDIITKKMSKEITFKYSYNDIQNHPLGKLTTTFVKLNSDTGLQKRLNTLKSYRDHLAHKSLLIASPSLTSETKNYFFGVSDNPIDYVQLDKELDDCIAVITQQYQRLKAASK